MDDDAAPLRRPLGESGARNGVAATSGASPAARVRTHDKTPCRATRRRLQDARRDAASARRGATRRLHAAARRGDAARRGVVVCVTIVVTAGNPRQVVALRETYAVHDDARAAASSPSPTWLATWRVHATGAPVATTTSTVASPPNGPSSSQYGS